MNLIGTAVAGIGHAGQMGARQQSAGINPLPLVASGPYPLDPSIISTSSIVLTRHIQPAIGGVRIENRLVIGIGGLHPSVGAALNLRIVHIGIALAVVGQHGFLPMYKFLLWQC